MYLIRDTFQCKPGKAKELVQKFKDAKPFMEEQKFKNVRLMRFYIQARSAGNNERLYDTGRRWETGNI